MKRFLPWLGLAFALGVGVVLAGLPPFDDPSRASVLGLPPVIILWTVITVICSCFLVGLAIRAVREREDDAA